jgi:hypothetical protein
MMVTKKAQRTKQALVEGAVFQPLRAATGPAVGAGTGVQGRKPLPFWVDWIAERNDRPRQASEPTGERPAL